MSAPLLNPLTEQRVKNFAERPTHALLLTGPTGSGKHTLAVIIAEQLLALPEGGFSDHPYTLLISPVDGKAIGIEAVRQLDRFLSLKVPGGAAHNRVIVIEDAHLLTTEAQNALLKTLEEPPHDTVLILTAAHERALLPTIRSRVQALPVGKLGKADVESHFGDRGHDTEAVRRAYAISGGLPGLMDALLEDSDHPLVAATNTARELLSHTAYERLSMVDELAKQRGLCLDMTLILQQIARLSLQRAKGPVADRWQRIMVASHEASEALQTNAQPKLALTKLMLAL
jgi:hypothetical protein